MYSFIFRETTVQIRKMSFRDSVHSCVAFVSSQSHPKMICLFGSSRPACQKPNPWGLAATPGMPQQQDGLCATCRQGPATAQALPVHSHLRAFASAAPSPGDAVPQTSATLAPPHHHIPASMSPKPQNPNMPPDHIFSLGFCHSVSFH